MKNRTRSFENGMSLIELAIGMASLVLIGGVIMGLFSAGMKSFIYTLRKTSVLTSARQAIEGGGSLHGMLWEVREALFVSDLTTSHLALNASDGTSVQYAVSNGDFLNTTQGVQKTQAQKVTSMQTQYYNMGGSGQVIQSTSAVSASFVTTWVQMVGTGKNSKTYTFFSGAELRNHP
jgi:hypothetical protein